MLRDRLQLLTNISEELIFLRCHTHLVRFSRLIFLCLIENYVANLGDSRGKSRFQ